MLFTIDQKKAQISADCYIAPGACVIGDVTLGHESSVWFNTIIRGDSDSIKFGAQTNVQDNSVVHTDDGIIVEIGKGVTIGHCCIIHGCTIGNNTLIGMGSTILNHAKIGANCIIGANALITQGMEIADNSLALGAPARLIRQLSEEEIENNRIVSDIYVQRARQYLNGLEVQKV